MLYAIPLVDGRWTACQIVGGEGSSLTVASLDWLGDAPPTEDALRDVPVLRRSHHAWTGEPEQTFVGRAPPPRAWRRVGERPLPALPACTSYGGWEGVGLAIVWQRRWDEATPEAAKRAYKDAHAHARERVEIALGGARATFPRGTSRLVVGPGNDLAPRPGEPVDWRVLDALPCLTELHYAGDDAGVIAWLEDKPLIRSFRWTAHGHARLDLSRLALEQLTLGDLGEVRAMALPPDLRTLTLLRGFDPSQLMIEHAGRGERLTLWVHGPAREVPLPVRGLERLTHLCLWGHAVVHAARVAGHAALEELAFYGRAPTSIPDVEALARLGALRRLELHACYGIDPERVPEASVWPAIERVVVDGLRKSAQPTLKQRLGAAPELVLRGAKTDAWLEANLDNPFRDWSDDAPTFGRKAADAWRKARTAVGDGARDPAEVEAALRTFVATFNRLAGKHDVDTLCREAIDDAFHGLAAAAKIAEADAQRWFDAWREF